MLFGLFHKKRDLAAEIAEVYNETLAELGSACPCSIVEEFDAVDGYEICLPTNAGMTEVEPDLQEHLAKALDRWGDRKFAPIR